MISSGSGFNCTTVKERDNGNKEINQSEASPNSHFFLMLACLSEP